MKAQHKSEFQNNDIQVDPALQNANFLVWRVMKSRQRSHDRDIYRGYNTRPRQRGEYQ